MMFPDLFPRFKILLAYRPATANDHIETQKGAVTARVEVDKILEIPNNTNTADLSVTVR